MRNSGYEYFHGDFAIVFALLLNKIGSRSTVSTDTIISVFPPVRLRLVWQSCQKAEISVNIRVF